MRTQADLHFFWSVSDHLSPYIALCLPCTCFIREGVCCFPVHVRKNTTWRDLNFYRVINYHSWLHATFACGVKHFFVQVCLALQDPKAYCNTRRHLINEVVEQFLSLDEPRRFEWETIFLHYLEQSRHFSDLLDFLWVDCFLLAENENGLGFTIFGHWD